MKTSKITINNIKLPKLKGTEEQVAWAEKLRKSFCKQYLKLTQIDEYDKTTCIYDVRSITSAIFWIENADLIEQENIFLAAENVFEESGR